MTAVSRKAASVVRTFLSFLLIAVFSLWVTDAQALSSGGGSSGGNSGGGNSGGNAGGGGSNGDRGGRDDGVFTGSNEELVTRAQTNQAPTGFVISDDICTGGKYESC